MIIMFNQQKGGFGSGFGNSSGGLFGNKTTTSSGLFGNTSSAFGTGATSSGFSFGGNAAHTSSMFGTPASKPTGSVFHPASTRGLAPSGFELLVKHEQQVRPRLARLQRRRSVGVCLGEVSLCYICLLYPGRFIYEIISVNV
ncbi:uncharacterized protein LOC144749339 [Ciona intestinalis]